MIVVDSNVLLDVLRSDSTWRMWSLAQLDTATEELFINEVVYAEIAPAFADSEAVDHFLQAAGIAFQSLPRAALFLAGSAHQRYRRARGLRERILPDFLIGAHAAVAKAAILTRDPRRYRSYFRDIRLVTP